MLAYGWSSVGVTPLPGHEGESISVALGITPLIAASGLTGLSAFAVGGVIDVSAGMIWDIAVRGYTPSEAFVSNLVAFGVGEVIGYGARRTARGISEAVSRLRPSPDTAFFWSGRTYG